jgi:hypothetical protein
MTERIDTPKIGDALVDKALQHILKKISEANKEQGPNKVVGELMAKDLEWIPTRIRKIAKWYAEEASRSDKKSKQSIEDLIREKEYRNSNKGVIRYSLGLLDSDIRKEIETIRTRLSTGDKESDDLTHLRNLERQLAAIELALRKDYVDEREEIERTRQLLKSNEISPERHD